MVGPSIEELDLRSASLIMSALVFGVVMAAWFVARKAHGHAPYGIKLGFLALILFAALRLYSASSFVWGPDASDLGLFPLLRAFVFVLLTIILIIVLALLAFYWRRLRGNRES